MKKLFLLGAIAGLVAFSAPSSAERYLNVQTHAEPETVDPNIATGNVEHIYIEALFEGLTTYDPKTLTAKPGVAEKWTMSPDGRIYTFTLRSNARWSDGTPLTAQDFVYSYERLLNPKTGGKFASMLYFLKNGEAYNIGKITDPKLLGVRAKDPQTLVLEFEYPVPFATFLTSHMTYMPVPKQAIEKHGVSWTRPENIVTNGAFVLQDWTPHKYATLVKNPHYWGKDSVTLPGIRFWPIEDQETGLRMYEEGQIDLLWYPPQAKLSSLRGRPDFVSAPWLASEFYWVNVKNPVLKDARVRRALAMAIDRKMLTEKFLQGYGSPLTSFTVQGIAGYTLPKNQPSFNPEAARQLLKDAGITDPGSIQLEILYNTKDEQKIVAQVVQQMWKQHLGINTQLINEEWKSYLKDLHQKNFTGLCRSGWVGDYLDPMTYLDMLPTGAPGNNGYWGNAEYDALIAKARAEPNAQKRMQLMTDAETILMTEMPVIPLYQKTKEYLIKPYVKGYYPNVLDAHPWKFVSMDGVGQPVAPWHLVRKRIS